MAADQITVTGHAPYAGEPTPVLTSVGPPVSGGPGIVGQINLDTSATPPVVYRNVGTALVSSWMSELSGPVV